MRNIMRLCLVVMALFLFQIPVQAAPAGGPAGPRLGAPGGGPVIDKSGDTQIQQMITSLVPQFVQERFVDEENGVTLAYSLFRPAASASGAARPLVVFMADASTPGTDVIRPLVQGYGALVWATEEWQGEPPCFILVPQFSGVAVNDAYERTAEVDRVLRLVQHIMNTETIDKDRVYTTGQSMGGMISMYFAATRPDIFAASVFVDCHWDETVFPALARTNFTFIAAGNSGKSFATIATLAKAAKADSRPVAFAEWSARLPLSEQDKLANALFAKGAPINIINFTPKSVLPSDGKGSEHMYSFDCAYRLRPVQEWLFRQAK